MNHSNDGRLRLAARGNDAWDAAAGHARDSHPRSVVRVRAESSRCPERTIIRVSISARARVLAILSKPAFGAGTQTGSSIPGTTVLANLSYTAFASLVCRGSSARSAEIGNTFVSLASCVRVTVGAGRSRKHDRRSGNVSGCHVVADDK